MYRGYQELENTAIVNQPALYTRHCNPHIDNLISLGLSRRTIEYFGLTCLPCANGIRVSAPIHDAAGRFLANIEVHLKLATKQYSESLVFPTSFIGDDVHYIDSSLLAYNANRLIAPTSSLLVVSTIAEVWWLHNQGFGAISLMHHRRCSISQSQQIIDLTTDDGIVYMVSGILPNCRRLVRSLTMKVIPFRQCRWIQLLNCQWLFNLSNSQLIELLEN